VVGSFLVKGIPIFIGIGDAKNKIKGLAIWLTP
jgi:hypothetical protein